MAITYNSTIAIVIIILIFWIWYTWDENEHFIIQTPHIAVQELISKLPTIQGLPIPNVPSNQLPPKSVKKHLPKPIKKHVPKPAQSKTPTHAPLSIIPEQLRNVK